VRAFLAAGSGEQVGGPGGVRPGQHPRRVRVAAPWPVVLRLLRQRLRMIGGGVADRVALAQQSGQRLPTRHLRPGPRTPAWVEAELLLGSRRVLFSLWAMLMVASKSIRSPPPGSGAAPVNVIT
jgi:hypothetical protein